MKIIVSEAGSHTDEWHTEDQFYIQVAQNV
jgi:hypothetical protein